MGVGRPEQEGLRRILEIVPPCHPVAVHQVEDGAGDRLVAAGRREGVVGGEMPERGRRHQVEAVGNGWSDHGRKLPVADREVFGQVVIERDVGLVEIGDRRILGRRDPVDRRLGVVHPHEAVHLGVHQREVRVLVVDLLVGREPAVIQVRDHAAREAVEGLHRMAVDIQVVIIAVQLAAFLEVAGQPVDAAVVAVRADRIGLVIGAARRVGQDPEIVVEGVVLLHHDDDVLHHAEIAVRQGGGGRDKAQQGGGGRQPGSDHRRDSHPARAGRGRWSGASARTQPPMHDTLMPES